MIERKCTPAGDPFMAAAQRQAQAELLDAAEAVLAWLDDRQMHVPQELLDAGEWRHRRALHAAIRKLQRS